MSYSWISRIQGTLYYNLSGYLIASTEKIYTVNSPANSNNINLVVGYPNDLRKISGSTIAIDLIEDKNIVDRFEVGPGHEYKIKAEYSVFCKTDRDVEVFLYELVNHTSYNPKYLKWDVVVLSGLSQGTTNDLVWFGEPLVKKIAVEEPEANELLNHRGSMTVEVSVLADNIDTL